jgi:hypothetical protein
MGQITIEIPQQISRNYRIASAESARKMLSEIEQLVEAESLPADDEILGLWAGRPESAEEIARDLRRKSNNRHLKNG